MEVKKEPTNSLIAKVLSDKDFNRLSGFIFSEVGIKMPYEKKIMLQSRLQKRLRALDMHDFNEYVNYVFDKQKSEEIIQMIDVVSTNKTDFFREADHFEFLTHTVLPEMAPTLGHSTPLKVWSAGSSTGEEAYTLAFTISDFLSEHKASFDYKILGTDISTKVLNIAREAVYKEERAAIVPLSTKKKYMLKSKEREKPTVRIKPEIRKKCHFQRLNFMDKAYSSITEKYDIVFCRNVLIYFSRETQEAVINKLCEKIRSGGYLFLGHSESITNMIVPLERIKPTVFKKI